MILDQIKSIIKTDGIFLFIVVLSTVSVGYGLINWDSTADLGSWITSLIVFIWAWGVFLWRVPKQLYFAKKTKEHYEGIALEPEWDDSFNANAYLNREWVDLDSPNNERLKRKYNAFRELSQKKRKFEKR